MSDSAPSLPEDGQSSGWTTQLTALPFLIFFTAILLRNAWVVGDAFITFRTIDNFINGYGLTWNVGERVQVYTHPLWMFLLCPFYYVTRELFFTSLFVSVILTLACMWIAMSRLLKDPFASFAFIFITLSSKAFMDYSASGLENPLSHFLLSCFVVYYLRGEHRRGYVLVLTLVACLAALNRLDTILFYCPAILYRVWTSNGRLKALRAVLIGATPLILWEAFALFYYGFPFPNTYYAKIQGDVPILIHVSQGLCYLLNSLSIDPPTLTVIGIALIAPLVSRHKDLLPVSLGILVYLVYIVMIGGGWMSGRFLTGCFFCSVLVLSVCCLQRLDRRSGSVVAAVLVLGFASPYPPIVSERKHGADLKGVADTVDESGIEDLRATHYKSAGLLNVSRHFRGGIPDYRRFPKERIVKRMVVTHVAIPAAFDWGPSVHVIDQYGLADPLLARIPSGPDYYFRVAHARRDIPAGYQETLETGKNVIRDRELAAYYDRLSHVIRGKLFDLERIGDICRINLGRYDGLLQAYAERVAEDKGQKLGDWSGYRPRRTRPMPRRTRP